MYRWPTYPSSDSAEVGKREQCSPDVFGHSQGIWNCDLEQTVGDTWRQQFCISAIRAISNTYDIQRIQIRVAVQLIPVTTGLRQGSYILSTLLRIYIEKALGNWKQK